MFSVSESNAKVLIVDDDPSQVIALNDALKGIAEVIFENKSPRAAERAANFSPEVILLDIEMPTMNGYEVLAQLKQQKVTQDIPVIFITSHNTVEEQVKCLSSGAVDFIVKPHHPDVIAARVAMHLKLKRNEKRITQMHQHAMVTLESLGDAVITTDGDCFVTYINPAAELLIGMPMKRALGKPIEEVMPLRIGADGPEHKNPVRLAIEEQRVVGMALNCRMRRQNGDWLAVEDSAAPLFSENGIPIGAVIVFSDINESRAMALRMSHSLQHDQLTDLPNRFLMVDQLKIEINRINPKHEKIGVILLDINRFKMINEEYGFEYGDALLKKISKKIRTQIFRDEMVSRHNADEFMIMVPRIQSNQHLYELAYNIKTSIEEISLSHSEIGNLSVRMGLSVYPDDASDVQSLMIHADTAMHRAKIESQHHGICFYSEEMESSFLARRDSYSQLKRAIAKQEIIPLYQPIVNSVTGRTEAVECLMRISDEQGNIIPPDLFIPLAEETRLIIPLGELLIAKCLEQLKIWCNRGFCLRMCINISPVQFLDPHFVPYLLSEIERTEVRTGLLELEVTEGLMMQPTEKILNDLNCLKRIGIKISIDDFGTGYSCLSYLQELPVDVLKIDRSFVARISEVSPDTPLVSTIASLAKSMKLKSIAEGVETSYQIERLKALGVDMLQGYYFSKPTEAESILELYEV